MKPEEFLNIINNDSNIDYGLCPTPINAEKGFDILIEHFLGKDWYTSSPVGKEQVYTEAIYEILKRNQNKSFISRLFKL